MWFLRVLLMLSLLTAFIGCRPRTEVLYIEPQYHTDHKAFVLEAQKKASPERLDSLGKMVGFQSSKFPLYETVDGCSGSTSEAARNRFTYACELHDICFRTGPSRARCDEEFYQNMQRKCSTLRIPSSDICYAEAYAMYKAVRLYPQGDYWFLKRQKEQRIYEAALLQSLRYLN